MKINIVAPGLASLTVIACTLVAGTVVAQQVTKPAPAAPAAPAATAKPATPAAHARPHRDAAPGPMRPPAFDEMDTNHDGMISKAEFDAFRAAHAMPGHPGGAGEAMAGGHMRGAWGGDMRGGWGRFAMRREMMWMHMHARMGEGRGGESMRHPPFDLKAADTDHDGKINWAEFQAAASTRLKDHFDHLDANHDGFIDATELPGRHEHREHGDNTPPPTAPAK